MNVRRKVEIRLALSALSAMCAMSLCAMTFLGANPVKVEYSASEGKLAHMAVSIPETDFAPYDRLLIDVVNEGPNADEINVQLGSAGDKLVTSFYKYGHFRRRHFAEVGRSCWTVDLGYWPKSVKSKKVELLQFFCVRPFGSKMRLERMRLLKPGEADEPVLRSGAEEVRIAALAKGAADRAAEERSAEMAKLAASCAAAGLSTGDMLVATATSMDQVRPFGTEGFSRLRASQSLALRLAQGEYESLQIVVTPSGGKTLRDVRVSVSDFVAEKGGVVLSATNATCEVTGYSRSLGVAAYRVGRRADAGSKSMRKVVNPVPGWWADPILPYMRRADVAPGTLQSFWVRVKCPPGQMSGVYLGSLVVEAANAKSASLPFRIRVNDFAVPRSTPLPLAITFNPKPPRFIETTADAERIERYRDDPEAPWKAWRRHRVEWSDFLAEYFITFDSLYPGSMGSHRDFDMLSRQLSKGRDGRINLHYWDYQKDAKVWDAIVGNVQSLYEKAKQFGVEDRVYLYGADEVPLERCGPTGDAARKLKALFPKIPLMTTAQDPDYGVGSALSAVDIFVPLTPRFDPGRAAKARSQGRQVWWYVADAPTETFANMHLECEPLDARSLMGAQTAKFRPDGFLFFAIAKWPNPRPLTSGPFTDLDARADCWAAFCGCGYWTVCGPDGTPVPTIRLENFRDGLEDLAYVKILEEKMKDACESDWKRRAKELVMVPGRVCKARDNFSTNPADIYAWRDAMADLIESAPRTNTNKTNTNKGK